MKKLMLCLSCLIGLSTMPALAHDAPGSEVSIFALERFTVAALLDYEMGYKAGDAVFPDPDKEFVAGAVVAYDLTPSLGLLGGSRIGADTKQVRSFIGLRLVLWDPARQKAR